MPDCTVAVMSHRAITMQLTRQRYHGGSVGYQLQSQLTFHWWRIFIHGAFPEILAIFHEELPKFLVSNNLPRAAAQLQQLLFHS